MSEGCIKYNLEWIKEDTVEYPQFRELNGWREKFYLLGMIGVYPDGVGFGNISARIDQTDAFVVSGSGTGALPKLGPNHYTPVVKCDMAKYSLTCQGPIKASSESFSHAIIYKTNPDIGAVIHVHNKQLWTNILKRVPTTAVGAAYGTLEMAQEIERLLMMSDAGTPKIIAMGGHEDGIISFGKDLSEAGNTLLEYYQRLWPFFDDSKSDPNLSAKRSICFVTSPNRV